MLDGLHDIIIEAKPLPLVLSIGSIMAPLELTIVVGNSEQVIDLRALLLLPFTQHELVQVQAVDRKLNMGVLLRLVALEPLQVDHQDRWRFEYLDLFDCLFVLLTFVAVPSVLRTQFFMSHELLEAVFYLDSV